MSVGIPQCIVFLTMVATSASMTTASAEDTVRTSKPISSVLREPLPAEELRLAENDVEFVIDGPTFTYRVQKATGAIHAICVNRDGQEVIRATGPADIQIDQYRLASELNTVTLVLRYRNGPSRTS